VGGKMREIVIPKEQAVFRMDRFGFWYNDGGRFEHKKIIDYFNISIRRDEQGYFVEQITEDVREKVYFDYEDTPLFVIDVHIAEHIRLLLNTRKTLRLSPGNLYVQQDNLYMTVGDERIKFTDRAMLKLATCMDHDGESYYFLVDGKRYQLPER